MPLLTAYPPMSNQSSLSSRGRFNQDSKPVKGSGMKRSLHSLLKAQVLGPAPRLAETRKEGPAQRAETCAKWKAGAW